MNNLYASSRRHVSTISTENSRIGRNISDDECDIESIESNNEDVMRDRMEMEQSSKDTFFHRYRTL
jgi:hypothetical protein